MKNSTRTVSEFTFGLDLGDRRSHIVCIGLEGEVIREDRVATTAVALKKYFLRHKPSRIAFEVGAHSHWVQHLLEECGHEIIVANPRQIPLIYKSHNKTDRSDADKLARLARFDVQLLCPVQHRGVSAQKDLAFLRSRDILVRTRASLITHARGLTKVFGARLAGCSAASFHRKAEEGIPDCLRPALDPIVSMIKELTDRIREFDRRIEELSKKVYRETLCLRQVTGVGSLTALAYVLTLEDPTRFKRSRKVGPFLGLTSRKKESSNQKPQLRISKAGDEYLRRLLVGSAWYIMGPFGPDTDLQRFGKAIARRGGKNAKKRAIVAVARKLAVLLHRLWLTGEVYEPLRNSDRSKADDTAA